MKKLILASRNEHKIQELRETLADLDIELKSALDFKELQEVEEDKLTLEGNALKKARYVFEKTGLPTLADDTGLEVDALDGRPGVFSARYAGEDASYQDNTDKLLAELAKVDNKDRLAQFRTVVAFIDENGEKHFFEGICRGKILKEERGDKGFGYDPVFQPEGYEETFAQLDSEEKNNISHRGRAIQKFYDWLQNAMRDE
ncbi:RdgB/HAM1 family non-canonical purine NTP pyrophosphatase [Aliifodinibius sp. S!AR15-10]|uniref:RdgB/HAM1 family non-canonical purine NTP pyrophosphatase n=1 Tax=Aliifodinibius sp. S!AR15-10 TaxID=2950437 RepID=UPI00285C9068|nr:RdgB/HAM1 family non-canonical purine NTP pyrophosphatase [Aliifodinibius sp. S!AR15-10]MDR8393063.1 RdgB/HAM1 family non-canonical purine NTP pyrophosphatase [Aliifodinibius sp. S!AR15-10]